MSSLYQRIPEGLVFYLSSPHPCSYLGEREALTLFADPNANIDTHLYSTLSELGFRRSGTLLYTPRCAGCNACLPVRVPVEQFHPDRSQRRVWRQNNDLTVRALPAEPREEHFALYQRYIQARHPDGSMNVAEMEQFHRFFFSPWSDTRYVEFSLKGRVVAVAVVDIVESGLSAVYTFFDPDERNRGLGVYAVLWQIEETRRRGLPFLYLGYLIRESQKMAYKERYQPLEYFRDGLWLPLPSLDCPPSPPHIIST